MGSLVACIPEADLPPFPDGLGDGASARRLLERAERWGVAEPPSFAGPLGIGVLLAR